MVDIVLAANGDAYAAGGEAGAVERADAEVGVGEGVVGGAVQAVDEGLAGGVVHDGEGGRLQLVGVHGVVAVLAGAAPAGEHGVACADDQGCKVEHGKYANTEGVLRLRGSSDARPVKVYRPEEMASAWGSAASLMLSVRVASLDSLSRAMS